MYYGNNGSLNYVATPITELEKKTPIDAQVTQPPIFFPEDDDRNPFEREDDDNFIPLIQTPVTAVTPTPKPSTSGSMTNQMITNMNTMMGVYKDGIYTGSNDYAYSGYIQVKAIITNGKLTDVQFPAHTTGPNTSRQIYDYSMPRLKTEAISAQSANINGVSGATYTSDAFKQSLAYALTQAKR